MLADRMRRCGWLVLLIAGCNGILPPPPPPKTRTAPPLADAPAKPTKKTEDVPRGPDSGPEHYKVKFETSKGDFIIQVHREWSPRGADQFHKLVKLGYYDNCKFFRVVPNFMAQFGISGDPKLNEQHMQKNIQDDQPVGIRNTRGKISFAKTDQPNSRSTQVFISFGDNSRLDSDGFTPFAEVIEGMDEVVDALNGEYGEETTNLQGTIAQVGNAVLDDRFPNLDFIKKASVLGADGKPEENSPAKPQSDATETSKESSETPPDTKDSEAEGGQ